MHSSSLCEYCYCLAGKQVCVKPKCLLPSDGCSPVFEKNSCCPIRYNCTKQEAFTEETIIATMHMNSGLQQQGGCLIDNIYYPEGSKVIDAGHSVCDNCFCLRRMLRCESLLCAPHLLGCTPVIKMGECCAASYNCNGTLEIKPKPNYGLFPTISKEYSKFRKEIYEKPPTKNFYKENEGVVTVVPFYVFAETLQEPTTKLVYQRSPDTYGTTRQFSGTRITPSSTQNPLNYDGNYILISNSKRQSTTQENKNEQKSTHATTNNEFQNDNFKKVFSTTIRSKLYYDMFRSSNMQPSKTKKETVDNIGLSNLNILSTLDSLLNSKVQRAASGVAAANTNKDNNDKTSNSAENNELPTSSDETSTILDTTTNNEYTTESFLYTSTFSSEAEETTLDVLEIEGPVTLTTILNSTDCVNGIEDKLRKGYQDEKSTATTMDPPEINKPAETRSENINNTNVKTKNLASEELFYKEVTSQVNKSKHHFKTNSTKLISNIDVIPNINDNKNVEDFDYDYNEPTLPPSLPNLKIIPFVAADALDVKKVFLKDPASSVKEKADNGPTEYGSEFKPPEETEGGFVPKEPSPNDNFQDNAVSMLSILHESTDQNIASSPTTTSSTDNLNTTRADNNIFSLDSVLQFIFSGRPNDIEKPISQTESTLRNEFTTPKQYDLNKLNEHQNYSTTLKPTRISEPKQNATHQNNTSGSYVKIELVKNQNLNKVEEKENISNTISPVETIKNKIGKHSKNQLDANNKTSTENVTTNIVKNSIGIGLLKLAGCNIYGRMYRVEKIIFELSGPCLECKCTEIGVQCRQLKCFSEASN
ncbi:unnamed protein product [Ceutorhynchus assimilis]|uniref:VWFC domain-containing protein n=1 Tax=Ceutorhynchus assimilis TaxID=467358 RepID=A0A9N9Q8W4_9CUCU|nr:unnamed protein product [Ceutorhynchus assimilis]